MGRSENIARYGIWPIPDTAEVCVLPKALVAGPQRAAGSAGEDRRRHVLNPHIIAICNDNDFDSEESVYDQEGNNVGKETNSAYYAQESATINERYGLGPLTVTDFSTKNSP